MGKTKCNVCFKKIPKGKKNCPSCAFSLKSGFLKGITMFLPLEDHGIEQWHLNKIWEYSEIVSEIDKITKMEGQDLQENELSVTLDVLELIDQIDDEEIKNSANRLLQLIIGRIVEYYEERRNYLIENDGESLKSELVSFNDMLWELIGDFEFTEEDIESILSIDKPYEIRKGYYRNLKSPRLKLFLGYKFKVSENFGRCKFFLEVLKTRQYFLREKPHNILNPPPYNKYLNEPIPLYNKIETNEITKKMENLREDFKDYIAKLNKFTLSEYDNEVVFNAAQIKDFSKLLTDLKKLKDRMYTVYDNLKDPLGITAREALFDILNKPVKEEAPEVELFCRYCGSKLAIDESFCSVCGKKF